ncbi:MAG: hypothetical protein LQ347_001559 [Umbilicaria vellea]|nr:MAG: hypothetical protein LQ347_001559 [Umbilicaria vellea]
MDTNLTEDFFDLIGKQYEDAFAHDPGLHQFIAKALAQLPPTATVLDVGCGTGRPVSSILAANGHRVLGIDRSQVMIDLSRRQVPTGTFEKADMLEHTPAVPLDALFAVFSLFALSRRQTIQMLSNFSQWLRPRGLLFLGTVAADGYPISAADYDPDGLCASGMESKFMGHMVTVTLFTKEGWKVLLEAAGFEITSAETALFTPPPSADCEEENHYYIAARKVAT